MKKIEVWQGLVLGCAFLASACGQPETTQADTQAQQWQDWQVQVQTRPSPPQDGMDEFLIIVTGAHEHPGSGCLVDIRTASADPWKQAIQDGRVGVYRRAALVSPGERRTVQVRLQCAKDQESGVLYFPLNVPSS
ncbi:MAG: hypothetical protein G3H99_03075 [Ferrovum sp.]|nr:hypothetical protein [Ferrovum sp.]NDU86884.1 hypothetical protein [Ferrovum sp.]